MVDVIEGWYERQGSTMTAIEVKYGTGGRGVIIRVVENMCAKERQHIGQ